MLSSDQSSTSLILSLMSPTTQSKKTRKTRKYRNNTLGPLVLGRARLSPSRLWRLGRSLPSRELSLAGSDPADFPLSQESEQRPAPGVAPLPLSIVSAGPGELVDRAELVMSQLPA